MSDADIETGHVRDRDVEVASADSANRPGSDHFVVETGHCRTELLARRQRYIEAATADNTRRAYRSAVRHFERWGGVLPTSPDKVIRYLLEHARRLNPRTLSLRLTALRRWHELQGFPDPTASPEVRKTLRGIERVHGRPKEKARVFSMDQLRAMLDAFEQEEGLRPLRDRALLLTGCLGAFRRSELVAVRVEHLQWEPRGVVILLPRSKTDKEGHGRRKALPRGAVSLCPVTALRDWLAAARIDDGPVFRSISRWGNLGTDALTPAAVSQVLRRAAERAGLENAAELSGHSLRRSLATSAYRAGASMEAIMRQGGWTSRTVREYIEEAGEFEDNAAGVLVGSDGT
jgi:integrase